MKVRGKHVYVGNITCSNQHIKGNHQFSRDLVSENEADISLGEIERSGSGGGHTELHWNLSIGHCLPNLHIFACAMIIHFL